MDPVMLPVRSDDLDTNGHVRGPAYLAYADHARWATLIGAGVDLRGLREHGLGPVNLETTILYLQELRSSDTVTVTSVTEWGTGEDPPHGATAAPGRWCPGRPGAQRVRIAGSLRPTSGSPPRRVLASPRHRTRVAGPVTPPREATQPVDRCCSRTAPTGSSIRVGILLAHPERVYDLLGAWGGRARSGTVPVELCPRCGREVTLYEVGGPRLAVAAPA